MILVLGATGTLGQAVVRQAEMRGLKVLPVARSKVLHPLDISDGSATVAFIRQHRPSAVINCAAIVDLDYCENSPSEAYLVNARAVLVIARACSELGSRLIHVSTDHYFTGDAELKHDECARVSLLNEYAATKFAGEAFAQAFNTGLVVRTNVTGWRGWSHRKTFIEWAVESIEEEGPIGAFSDFFTSTIDAGSLAQALLDLVSSSVAGVLNVASRDVVSKERFLRVLADKLGKPEREFQKSSVRTLRVPRAESLGLDVSRAETFLGRRLPSCEDVVDALLRARRSTGSRHL